MNRRRAPTNLLVQYVLPVQVRLPVDLHSRSHSSFDYPPSLVRMCVVSPSGLLVC